MQQQPLAGAQAKALEGHVHSAPGRNQRGRGRERQCRGLPHEQPCIGSDKARETAVGRSKDCGVRWQLCDVRSVSRDGASNVGASGTHARIARVLPQHNEHIAEVEADCTDPHLHLAVSEGSVGLRLRGDLQIGNGAHRWQLQPDGPGDGRCLHDKPVNLAGLTPHQHLWLGRRAQLQAPHRTALVPKLAGADGLREARCN